MTDHHEAPPAKEAPAGKLSTTRRTIKILDMAIFETRWILYPINLGLFAALAVYVYRFLTEAYVLGMHAMSMNNEEMMVGLVGLVDVAMVANLLIMIIQGNHQIFIRRLEISDPRDRPQWLDHIDSGILKVKVALSVVGITLVQLLKDFVNIEHVDWTTTIHRVELHLRRPGLCADRRRHLAHHASQGRRGPQPGEVVAADGPQKIRRNGSGGFSPRNKSDGQAPTGFKPSQR